MNKTQFVQISRQPKVSEAEYNELTNSMYQQVWENLAPPQIITNDLKENRAENVITPADTPIPDCMTCGACCNAFPSVAVYPDEVLPRENYWEVTIKGKKGEITVDRFLRRDGETLSCTALQGKIGEHVLCNIYEQRPRVCDNFEAGSDKCHAIRRAYGIEPFLSLMDMYYAVQKLKAIPEKPKSSEEILLVNFIEQPETGYLEMKAVMTDDSTQILHTFDPTQESWHQFEFKGMTLFYAKNLIESRRQNQTEQADNI